MTGDEYIDNLEDPQRQIARELSRIVKDAAPSAKVSIKWGMPVFEKDGLLCYIGGMKKYANFGFYKGAQLPDPEGLLEGTGKALRHTKVRSLKDVKPGPFEDLVKAAVRLNAG